MPYKEHEINKVYFTIGEVAEQLGVLKSKIDFWTKSLKIGCKTNAKGDRYFTQKQIDHFMRMYELINEEGYRPWGAHRRARMEERGLLSKHTIEALRKGGHDV